ncbi:MAG: non-hydrolyzing UDP-N-acetylglucosamine 2-epimerase [Bacillota bacterium]
MKKVALVFGTRPEAIKMMPVIKELESSVELEPVVIVTAQHRELLDQVLKLFAIRPDYDLNIMQQEQTLEMITTQALKQLGTILQEEDPDILLVHGDTTTAFVGALAGFYHQIPVGHVEAGLRSYDKYNPYPEEVNRRLSGVLADLHFAPTESAADNLLQEGVAKESIFVTGNTVVDALTSIYNPDYQFRVSCLQKLDFTEQETLLLTVHRRENLGEPLLTICQTLQKLVNLRPKLKVIFPVHPNPKVQSIVEEELGDLANVYLLNSLNYETFINLLARVNLIWTDSGGIQEEATVLGKLVLLLRETTERPEAITAGNIRLVSTDQQQIITQSLALLEQKQNRDCNITEEIYGTGQAAEQIKDILVDYLF